jgi:hypothetical protein
MCRQDQAGCEGAQELAMVGIHLFLMAHESAHYIYDHTGKTLAQELAADQYAWNFVMRVAQSLHGNDKDDNDNIDELFAAAAQAPLWYERQSEAWAASVSPRPAKTTTDLEERIRQLASFARTKKIIVSQFLPRPYSNFSVLAAKITFDTPPQLLLVSGIPVPVQEAQNSLMRLPDALVYIMAVDTRGFSCVEHSGSERIVNLKLEPWSSESTTKLNEYRTDGNWCALIRATADAQLHPRSAAVASLLNEALSNVDAGLFIDATMAPEGKARQDADRYRRRATRLRSWGAK